MSLAALDVLNEIHSHTVARGELCTVRAALDQLPPDVAAGYAAAIALPKETAQGAAIERALKARGVTLRQHVIQRHRRDGCPCCADLTATDD